MKAKRVLALVLSFAMIATGLSFESLAMEGSDSGENEEVIVEEEESQINGTPVDAGLDVTTDVITSETAELNTEESEEETEEDEIDISSLCGYIDTDEPPFPTVEYVSNDGELGLNGADDVTIPSSYCSGENHSIELPSYMPLLRYQYNGTCWAHASMALAEIYMCKDGGFDAATTDLSELQLAYFSYKTVTDPLGGTAGDSNSWKRTSDATVITDRGGSLHYSENILAGWVGAGDESLANEYDTAVQSKVDSTGLDSSIAYNDTVILTDYINVNLKTNPELVKKLILENGAVGTSFYVRDDYSTVYNETNNCYYDNSQSSTNHAVTIIGWDDDYPASNFSSSKKPSKNGAWLIRNSWCKEADSDENKYSLRGYFWLSYADTSISEDAYSFKFANASTYDHNYQYDGSMVSNSWALSQTLKIANIFTAKANSDGKEILKAAAFAIGSTNVDYTLDVYKFESDDETYKTNPQGGEKVATKSGTTEYSGYYTVNLDSDVILEENEKFAVVVTLSSQDTSKVALDYEYAMSNADWFKTTTSANAYESFYDYGSGWMDFGTKIKGNLRIKAFTNDYEITADPITDFSIPDEYKDGIYLTKGESKELDVSVTPEGSEELLSFESLNPTIASVNSTGKITGLSAGKATIAVSATIDGETVTKNVTVYVSELSVSGDTSALVGATKTYTYTLDGDSSLNEKLTWSTSNSEIATVDGDGNVTFNEAGDVDIIISSAHYSASISVTVKIADIDLKATVTSTGKLSLEWAKIPGVDQYTFKLKNSKGTEVIFTSSDIRDHYSFDYDGYVDKDIEYVEVDVFLKFKKNGEDTTKAGMGKFYLGRANKITYLLDGGTNDSDNPNDVLAGNTGTTLLSATKTGYSFGGWYSDETFSTQVTAVDGLATHDYTLYAKWNPISYKLQYMNGTTAYSSTDTLYYGDDTYTAKGNLFPDSLYDLYGWTTGPDGTGTLYKEGAVVKNLSTTEGETVYLYAVWDTNVYDITYNLNGGTNSESNPAFYKGSQDTVTLYEPTKTGYTFLYWIDGNNKIVHDTYTVNKKKLVDITLTAYYKANTYTVKFDANSTYQSGSMEDYTATYDKAFTIPNTGYSKAWYVVNNWNTLANGKGQSYSTGESVINLTDEADGVVTLYAIWQRESIRVYFETGDSEITNPDCRFVKTGSTYGELPVVSKDGYIFEGWYTKASGGTKITADSTVAVYDDITLYAQFSLPDTSNTCAAPISNITTTYIVDYGTELTFTTETAGASIYYTTDGTTPTSASSLYSAAIEITKDITVKAIAIKAGMSNSSVVTYNYTLSSSDAADQGDVLDEDLPSGDTKAARIAAIPTGIWVGNISSVTYTGSVITPTVRVYYGKKLLKKNTDYTVSCKQKLINAGTYTLIIKGKGNYTGSREASFTITPLNIQSDLSKIVDYSVAYASPKNDKNGISPSFTVMWNGKKLKKGTDYTLVLRGTEESTNLAQRLDENEDSHTYTFTITAKGNFTGVIDRSMTLKRDAIDLSKAKVSITKKIAAESLLKTDGSLYEATPVPTVTLSGETLTAGTDYTVSYLNNAKAGTATCVILAKGDEYVGSKSVNFTITGISLKNYKVVFRNKETKAVISSVVYSGEAPDVEVILVNRTNSSKIAYPESDTDNFTITKQETFGKGTYKVKVTGKNSYSGWASNTIKITQYDFASATSETEISGSDSIALTSGDVCIYYNYSTEYTAGGAKPDITVKFNGSTLTEGTDYKVSYSNNVLTSSESKKAYFKVTGKGNFKGSFYYNKASSVTSIPYSVTAKNIGDSTVVLYAPDLVANGKAGSLSTVTVTDTVSNTKLKASTDYNNVTYTYVNATTVKNSKKKSISRAAGAAVEKTDILPTDSFTAIKVEVTGIGGYGLNSGRTSTIYYVYPKAKSISGATVKVKNKTYTGKAITITQDDITSIKLKSGGKTYTLTDDDYEIVAGSYKNNVNKGTATVTIKGTGERFCGSKTIKFKIVQRSVSN